MFLIKIGGTVFEFHQPLSVSTKHFQFSQINKQPPATAVTPVPDHG